MLTIGFISTFIPRTPPTLKSCPGIRKSSATYLLPRVKQRTVRVSDLSHHTRTRQRSRSPPPSCFWIERSEEVQIEASKDELFIYFSNIETLPTWSPWIQSVTVNSMDPRISRWVLEGPHGLKFEWEKRLSDVEMGSLIAWQSTSGIPNEGEVRFKEVNDECALIILSVRVDVPVFALSIMSPTFIKKFLGETMMKDLSRFREFSLRQKRHRVQHGLPVPERASEFVELAIQKLTEEDE